MSANEAEKGNQDAMKGSEKSETPSHGGGTLWNRIRQATGTVYGDIGTSVLYTVMEITRERLSFSSIIIWGMNKPQHWSWQVVIY